MSSRFRIVALVLGLTIVTGLKAQEDVANPEVEPQPTQQRATDQTAADPTLTEPAVRTPTDEASAEHNQAGSESGESEVRKVPDIILGDGWAQWAMALFALMGVIISGWAVWLLKKTLDATVIAVREGEKATSASLEAASAAREANQIMRDEQRPWLDIIASPSGQLTYMPDSDTIAIPFDITVKNMGKSPAFNVAIDLGLSAVPDDGQGALGGEAQIALNTRLIESAQRRSINNNLTTTIFPDHSHHLNGWLAHAHFVRDGIKEGQKFGLIFAATVAYGPAKNPLYITILPVPILHGFETGLFGFAVEDIKAGKGAFKFTAIEKAKLF